MYNDKKDEEEKYNKITMKMTMIITKKNNNEKYNKKTF